MRGLLSSSRSRMEIYRLRGNGDALVVIFLKTNSLQHMPAGVRKKLILSQFLVSHHTLVAKLVASLELQENVHIHVSYFVMPDRALHVLTRAPL